MIGASMTLLALTAETAEITGLYRFPVKGLGSDSLAQVQITEPGETFPDDRRYALLWERNIDRWDKDKPQWLHKENFLCAFTDPELMSKYVSCYRIVGTNQQDKSASFGSPCDAIHPGGTIQRLLTLRSRSTNQQLLGPVDLSTREGRRDLAQFFQAQTGKHIQCVTAASGCKHVHQFGNTSSGVKERGDTRTVHIVNAATVRDLAETLGISINPTRFRPNIVLDGVKAWTELDWVGKKISCGQVKLAVIRQTVRCDGVSVDPLDPSNILDIPGLLVKHYPQYGPYFGVYAVVEDPGVMKLGDGVTLLS